MINGIVARLPRAIVACVIVVVAMAIARAVRDIVEGAPGQASYGKVLATAAWAFVVGLGVIAAPGQAGIATAITGPVLTAVLAMIAGVVIVGVGGGLVTPMRDRWERRPSAAEQETGRARDRIPACRRGRGDARSGMPSAQERATRREREERGGPQEPPMDPMQARESHEPSTDPAQAPALTRPAGRAPGSASRPPSGGGSRSRGRRARSSRPRRAGR